MYSQQNHTLIAKLHASNGDFTIIQKFLEALLDIEVPKLQLQPC